jgi:uncharacterized repeat protein (TIGR01451 family)
MKRGSSKFCAVVLIALMALAAAMAQSPSGVLELISVSSQEVQGNGDSGSAGFLDSPNSDRAGVSDDGRFVAFMSLADNLVPEDTNFAPDVFVRDRLTGTTERVSVTSKGRQGIDDSGVVPDGADISNNGNLVVFASYASNLARGDVNGNADVFIHNRTTRTTELVSRGLDGAPATGDRPVISGNGRFVAFTSFAQNLVADHPEFEFNNHVYVYDVETQLIERIDVNSDEQLAAGAALHVEISETGQYVAFDSHAENLIPIPGDNGAWDVFVRDRTGGMTHGVSTVGDSGGFDPDSFLSSISPDGFTVGFDSADSFDGDTNGFLDDAFVAEAGDGGSVRDWQTVTVQLVSRDSNGNQGQGVGAESRNPLVSADGNSVIFSSRAHLVPEDTNDGFDVYRRDLATGTTVRLAADDAPANSADVIGSDITPDGRVVTLLTGADLVPGDVNFRIDVYALDMRAAADLSLTMTDSPDPVAARSNLTYTLTVRNAGPGAATDVTLTDQLPADTVFMSATTTQGSCTRTGGGKSNGVLTCSLGAISAGSTATVTIVISPSRAGMVTNTAAVQASSPDGNLLNNSDTEDTAVNPR